MKRQRAALLSYDSVVINPRQATLALLKAACARRTSIYSPVEIAAISSLRPAMNCRIACPRRGHKIISTWAIATPRRLALTGRPDADADLYDF